MPVLEEDHGLTADVGHGWSKPGGFHHLFGDLTKKKVLFQEKTDEALDYRLIHGPFVIYQFTTQSAYPKNIPFFKHHQTHCQTHLPVSIFSAGRAADPMHVVINGAHVKNDHMGNAGDVNATSNDVLKRFEVWLVAQVTKKNTL